MPTVADATGRRRAVAIAGHRGQGDVVRTFLDDPDGAVRATALGALQRAGALSAEDLRAGVADADPRVRIRAAELVAELRGGTVAAAVAIVGLLDDPDPVVVEAAAWAAGERDPAEPGAVARLAVLATEADDALVRESAVAALGSLGDPAALPAILAATTDKATVRRRAVIALAPFEGDEVDAAFERALTDRDWQVRQVAEDLAGPGAAEDADDAPDEGGGEAPH
ncbi:HEAT repeat domain-containing protein [Aquihabitans sp. G128]|uniref:HEAT repeat domain-containing protein n=1 Tax=Aquihabitans sp. G128 TaxID=2849779 RepID=UPI001C24F4E3|nr:HEAT repeat domain-containing protein [Aquihabitans sp. G128]QXC60466.1 HEAT repeat domain-containing protein [Aquihabitans sp. G128]